MIPEAAARAIGRPLAAARPVPGGDINDAWLVEFDDGTRAFVKARAGAAPGEYATEAAGLRWLGAVADGLRVPEVLAVDDAFLALGWIDTGRLDARGEEELGRGLALVHAAGAPAFGATPHLPRPAGSLSRPGASHLPRPEGSSPLRSASASPLRAAPALGLRLGAVELPAATGSDWPTFYAEHRLAPLVRLAEVHGALPAGGRAAIEAVIARLPELAGPAEPPARLHGDLWSGNVLAGADGRPWLIDPAAHGGHREIDLAMLRLFGAPAPRTLAAYAEAHPLAPGHETRVPLWQLLPLLVHAVLFGGSYGDAAVRAARRAAP